MKPSTLTFPLSSSHPSSTKPKNHFPPFTPRNPQNMPPPPSLSSTSSSSTPFSSRPASTSSSTSSSSATSSRSSGALQFTLDLRTGKGGKKGNLSTPSPFHTLHCELIRDLGGIEKWLLKIEPKNKSSNSGAGSGSGSKAARSMKTARSY